MSDDAIPHVSIIMANHNGGRYVTQAVRSVLRQTLTSLELIFSDDGSTDDSPALASAAAENDKRFVFLRSNAPTGPAAARNRALAAARGQWIAIVDSDDWIHPTRLETLIGAAERDKADIITDDLLVFYEGRARPAHGHLEGALAAAPSWLDAYAYVHANLGKPKSPALGYLKPILRRSLLDTPQPYDETLRNGEDYELVFRLLCSGSKLRLYPDPLYFYRKHTASVSHRRSAVEVEAMIEAQDRKKAYGSGDTRLMSALARRRQSLNHEFAFCRLVEALKAKRMGDALGIAATRPSLIWRLREALWNRIAAPFSARPATNTQRAAKPQAFILSAQRVSGASGSAVYLHSIAQALGKSGFEVCFLGVTPKLFGRTPFLLLNERTRAFEQMHVNGGIQVGSVILALNPALYGAALLGVLQMALRRLGFSGVTLSRASEYSIAAAHLRENKIYVARHALGCADFVLCDYAPLAPYAAFAGAGSGRPPAVVVMHDLMSAHQKTLEAQGIKAHFTLSEDEEYRLLSFSDAVLAIQPQEEQAVRSALGDRVDVMLAPCPMTPKTASPAPGGGNDVLFVGSLTSANAHGLAWFIAHAWPTILAAHPSARLLIAGAVGRSVGNVPNAVKLGVVKNLDAIYAQASVVIAPLRAGSGLKIKLVEALAAGKAIVATSLAAEGMESFSQGAAIIQDDPHLFGEAVSALLKDRAQREALGARALDCVAKRFSEDACFGSFMAFARSTAQTASTPNSAT